MPALGCPVVIRAASTIPANPESPPQSDVGEHLHAADVDARGPRGVFVAADGINVPADPRVWPG